MKDEDKTKEQLINEQVELRRRITELEALEIKRKRAEEELKIKDSAIASSINAIAIANLEGNLTYVNSSFLKMWGYDDENEVFGEPLFALLVLTKAVQFWQIEKKVKEVVEALRDRGGWIGEMLAKRKDGSVFDILISASTVTDEIGKPICTIASFVDITERKQLEQELKENRDFLENLIQESPTAILSTDSTGNVVIINKSAEKLVGYKSNELMGKPLSMAVSGQLDLEIADKKDFILNFVKKDGTEIPLSVSTSVQLLAGEQRGLIVTLKDLSELRGLFITPVSEVGVEAEMKYQLEQGFMYIVEEEKPEKSFDVFLDLVKHGSQGLYISRQNPTRIREKYQLEKTPNIWLTRAKISEGNCISPDELAKLYKTTENFVRQADDGVIFFEGLEYLIAQNGFQPALKFIQSLNDVIMVHPSRLIVIVDPLTLDTKELHIFRRDMKTIF